MKHKSIITFYKFSVTENAMLDDATANIIEAEYSGIIKRGDTFIREFTLTDEDTGDPIDANVNTLSCQIRTANDKLVDILSIAKSDSEGSYILSSEDTNGYPVGMVYLDVQYSNNGITISTKIYSFTVERDVTHP